MDDTSAHVQRTSDSSLSHSRLVQSSDLRVSCIAFVATDLLLSLGRGQGRKLHVLSHLSMRQVRLNLDLGLVSARSCRCAWRGPACSDACLRLQSTGEA